VYTVLEMEEHLIMFMMLLICTFLISAPVNKEVCSLGTQCGEEALVIAI
jgi:hypothetical protein